ncbi:MAG: serine/threonine-protein kinase [Gemmatimonadota bacterium]
MAETPDDTRRERAALRLMDLALDRPQEERDAVLVREAGPDAALLTRARSLLAATTEAESRPRFLGERAAEYAASLVESVGAALRSTEVLRPEVRSALAHRYEFVRELGRGGTAVVYLARDLANDRDVAIKLIRSVATDSNHRERFVREIGIVAALRHPCIVQLLDSGEVDDVPYYVMPFLKGESLRQRIDRDAPLPLADALGITGDVASALDHAHQRGIVHRDIKPLNILLDGDRALVADFGIALALEHAVPRLTSGHVVLGTPAYMSPEQAGRLSEADHRSDIYSLACVVYEMLAGEAAFSGPNTMSVVAKQIAAPPPDILILRRELGPVVQKALLRALAKDPAQRFASAGEFAAALST